jgi:recombination protein RecR
MNKKEIKCIEQLIDLFEQIPTIGKKSAENIAYSILNMNIADKLITILKNIKKVYHCPVCGLYIENNYCHFCNDEKRNHSQIMVISYPKNAYIFEKNNIYNGMYHVLNGTINISANNISSLYINSLIKRINNPNVKEVIIATDHTLDGETTAKYIMLQISKNKLEKKIKITRLACGIPIGGCIDYVDESTIQQALNNRIKIN